MNDKTPKATHSGILKIGNAEIPCHVLENGERILSTRGIMKSIGRTWRGRKYSGTQLPVFLEAKNLKSYITDDLATVLSPKTFKPKTGHQSEGYKAEILPVICDIYLKANDDRVLTPAQERIAVNCEILVRALSKVGIIALVDEATGYQYDRDRDELNKILEAYIAKELLPWAKRFPDEFYKQIYKLKKWPYPTGGKRTPLVGKITNQIVYEKLPQGVLDELRKKNPVTPRGYRKHRHHQFLTENIGNPHLERHIASVTTLMRASSNWRNFKSLFEKAFSDQEQLEMSFMEAQKK